jgi:hypothetical protein
MVDLILSNEEKMTRKTSCVFLPFLSGEVTIADEL